LISRDDVSPRRSDTAQFVVLTGILEGLSGQENGLKQQKTWQNPGPQTLVGVCPSPNTPPVAPPHLQ
jgi:hypothetical protein